MSRRICAALLLAHGRCLRRRLRRAARLGHRSGRRPGRGRGELLGQHRRASSAAPTPPPPASSSTRPRTRTPTSRPPATPGRMATAQLAIVNGIGYDPWASQLLAANPVDGRITLDVGIAAAPARPATTRTAGMTRLTSRGSRPPSPPTLERLDPRHRAYYAAAPAPISRPTSLPRYHGLIADDPPGATRGVAVGASESIFALQAPALGLDLITPPSFMQRDQRGRRADRPGHRHGRAPDHRPPDQGLGLQRPERHPRGPAAERAGRQGRDPHRDRDRDPVAPD